jgi:phage tail P2-like protein
MVVRDDGNLPVRYEEHLLPENTTWLMRVLAAAGELRVAAIPAPIDTVKQPPIVPPAFEPWLAWELSVDLWLDNWSQQQLRWMLANSLRLHSRKGTLGCISEYVSTVGGTVVEAIRPPAKLYPMPQLTDAERQKYLDRFPQLRVYPYVARAQLPWLCYFGNADGKNGRFVGHLFPTNADAGGRWTRTATLFDNGVETQLTFREVKEVDTSGSVRTYDEATLPARPGTKWFANEPPKAHIYLGRLDPVDQRIVRIPRDGSLELIQFKANYTTVEPGLDMIAVYPQHEFIEHDKQAGSCFPGHCHLAKTYLTTSIAWRYIYERWYLHDPTRVPDVRKRSTHMGHARLGIPPFTAELKISIPGQLNPRYFTRWMWGFLRPRGGSSDMIARARAAVSRAMSLRDEILIQTKVLRTVQVADAILCDGSIAVGDLIEG